MLVFKFGGASVKDAASVRNVVRIIQSYPNQQILVVVSAMGKMTNKLEEIVLALTKKDYGLLDQLQKEFYAYHLTIFNELFEENIEELKPKFQAKFEEFFSMCNQASSLSNAMVYDAIVPYGELLSTWIVHHYLSTFFKSVLLDASTVVKTDDKFKSATVNMRKTCELVCSQVDALFSDVNIVVTQGFIGSADSGARTTLGREGSDYTGAIFSYCLDAESLTIWKDVDGMYNADPKAFPKAQKIDEVSYKDAIELSYYGASVIHPKTIQPLQNKGIPLYVKSFLNPSLSGTVIKQNAKNQIPCFIVKKEQVLVSLSSKDFSFIVERHLADIFNRYDELNMKINIMQNSAVNFSALFDAQVFDEARVLDAFSRDYEVRYNTNLELLTIRHYNEEIINELTYQKEILLEQRTRETVRFVMR
jgi:aspartate kinase